SDGGYMCAATELCLANGIGANLTFPASGSLLGYFVEHQGSFMIAVAQQDLESVLERANAASLYAGKQGDLGGDAIILNENVINLPLSRLREAHEGWLPNYMSSVDA
ncbi:MAG: phosphoribosylformylglycinamidine synthase II, partial [Alphaproteobacteria bacterium]|nr:phosphoribosylformylglycinamidine synthase II [Alphaproteobacteria bacterium]